MRKAWGLRAAVLLAAALVTAGPLGRAAAAGPPDEADGFQVKSEDVYIRFAENLANPDSSPPRTSSRTT